MPSVGNLSISQLVIGEYLETMMNQHKADLGIADVFFGDQAKLPRTPAVCIEPDTMQGGLQSAQRKVEYTADFLLLVYYDKVQDSISNRKGLLALVDGIEFVVNSDVYLGTDRTTGLVFHGYISKKESGYISKGATLMTAARMTYSCVTQRILP